MSLASMTGNPPLICCLVIVLVTSYSRSLPKSRDNAVGCRSTLTEVYRGGCAIKYMMCNLAGYEVSNNPACSPSLGWPFLT
ncbi:hypothetical protein SAMD00023353_0202130 [Rosellinia necatrix]|uniref:Secreted protein n=1 Tax=Rosellinia necatrix TaxID=77044 RepID=A0A1S7UJL4_ROSNE|nr:hypothetical protein SAMD00023353_0202130 [Rosellinia necatrix]